jgi:hypothetical protein
MSWPKNLPPRPTEWEVLDSSWNKRATAVGHRWTSNMCLTSWEGFPEQSPFPLNQL